MTNIASVLKSEISRLARKQSRAEIEGLRKLVSAQRSDIASLKKRVQDMERTLKVLGKLQPVSSRQSLSKDSSESESNLRFSAKGLSANRKRLGLSAAQFALLVGTTQQSIFSWERGQTQPRAKFLAAIASLRGIGKREVAERLAKLNTPL